MFVIVSVISTALVLSFLTYVAMIYVPFLRRKPEPEGDASLFEWHFFVPCRDEEAVIDTTIRRLRDTFPAAGVWVIDDDSDDDTAAIVAAWSDRDPHVHLVQRRRPDARIGKGAALNSAYRQLIASLPDDADHSRIVVCVVDADGEMAENALRQVAGPAAFGDRRVGAAQITVWMKNRNDRPRPWTMRGALEQLLVRMQDLEFRTIIAAMQTLRTRTQTVGLGGNGQFTRLDVLDEIDRTYGEPWHGSLLEDYELGVHVLLAGHQIRHVHDTHVEQEGLTNARRFLTQRTRWAQGNIQCSKYLLPILRSPHIDTAGRARIGLLPRAALRAAPRLRDLGAPRRLPRRSGLRLPRRFVCLGGGQLAAADRRAVRRVGPFAIWGPVYRRYCEPRASLWSAAGWGFAAWIYSFYTWVSSTRAFTRILLRRSGWAKTRRNAEISTPDLVAKEH